MKKTLEIKPRAGGTVSFTDLERFVTEARTQGAGELGTTVRATVRFNGTLRSVSVDIEDGGDKETDEFMAKQW
jgi:hypothetical protein